MRLSEWAVRHPVTVSMFAIGAVLLGVAAWQNLNLELYPDLQLPYVTVATVYPGADPATVEEEITGPIEGLLTTTPGLRRIESLSMENLSLVFGEFRWGTPLGDTIEEIRTKLAALALTLPAEAQAPVVMRLDPNHFPSLLIGVASPQGPEAATEAALQIIRPRLARITGVAQVTVLGGVEREIQVRYDSEKLQQHGLTPARLEQLLALQNATIPAGTLEDGGTRYQLRVGNHFSGAQQIRDLVIGENRLPVQGLAALWPPLLHVKDVAEVVDTLRPPTGYARIDGQPAVLLQVLKQSDANTVAVADAVRQALGELEAELADVSLTVIMDQSKTVRLHLSNLATTGLYGCLVAVFVLLAFLRHWKSSFVVALSLPLSVLAAVIVLYLLGLDLNLMTIGGLAMGIGMVVDNAIIVLESIARHRSLGKSSVDAAIDGSQEVIGAAAGATLTTVAVFLPLLFLDGFAGRLLKDLGLTVSLSLVASLAVAATVIPAAAARLVGAGNVAAGDSWDRGVLARSYVRFLEKAVSRPGTVLVVAALAVIATASLVPGLGIEFLPRMHTRTLHVTLEMPSGTPLSETDAAAREAERRLLLVPEVRSVAAQVGEQRQEDLISLLGEYRPNTAQLTLFLAPPSEQRDMAAIVADIRNALADLPAARISVREEWSSTSSVLSNEIVLQVQGPDLETLHRLAEELARRLRQSDAVADAYVPLGQPEPELYLAVNQSRALIGGMTTAQVSLAVRNVLSGVEVTQVRENGRVIPVVLRPKPEEITDLDGLLNHRISSPVVVDASDATAIRLANVVEVVETTGQQAIRRIDGVRAVEVRVQPAGSDMRRVNQAVDAAVSSLEVPPGFEIRTAGMRQLIAESTSDLLRALAWALTLVFMVMAAKFESWRHPLIIIVTVPLAGMGAVWALRLTGQNLGVASLLGLMVLGGIAVNNGIVLVDRINQLRRDGVPLLAAAVDASVTRLRPVLMTAGTTVAGLLPLALRRGEGTEFQVPVAITAIGGLIASTLLTLLVVPAMYVLMEGRRPHRPDLRGQLGARVGAALVALGVSWLFPAGTAAQSGGEGIQLLAGVGYAGGIPQPVYVIGAGWDGRIKDVEWKLAAAVGIGPDGRAPLLAAGASARWFQPVSFFGYYELAGKLDWRQTGSGPMVPAISVTGRGVLGNVTGAVEFDTLAPGFPSVPWDDPLRAELSRGGTGGSRFWAEIREQPNRELILIREFEWSDRPGPAGATGVLFAGGAEVRAGDGWLLSKAGAAVMRGEVRAVFGTAYRFRPGPYSQLSMTVASVAGPGFEPRMALDYELLNDDLSLTVSVSLRQPDPGRWLPGLFVRAEPHAGGPSWQIVWGSPGSDVTPSVGVFTEF
ncbi:MAG: efflux RND transporter permease subunit [Firmicutes bacterium]|nr:efflux RND transporter permease subunit [Bacillota bacterium]